VERARKRSRIDVDMSMWSLPKRRKLL
jgi:hypothetical protein